jgi:hypothetical protein
MGFEILKITDSKGRRFSSFADAIESDIKAALSDELAKTRAQASPAHSRRSSFAQSRKPGLQARPPRQSAGARAAAAVARAAEIDHEKHRTSDLL